MFVNNFDYNDYFSSRRGNLKNEHSAVVGTSAVSIITTKQSITTLTLPWIDESGEMTSGLGGHSITAEELIKKMFPSLENNYQEILDECIYIMYSSREKYSMCIVYLPYNISYEQYLLLQEYSKSIEESLKNKEWDLEVHTSCIKNGNEYRVYDLNNLNNTLVEAKNRIVDYYELPFEEKIIVKTRKNKNE